MRVDGHHPGPPGPTHATAPPVTRAPAKVEPVTAAHDSAGTTTTDTMTADGKARGVVAKLGTGHFNPVAEMRLRLKHLSAEAAAALPEVDGSAAKGRGFQRAVDAYEAARPTPTVPPPDVPTIDVPLPEVPTPDAPVPDVPTAGTEPDDVDADVVDVDVLPSDDPAGPDLDVLPSDPEQAA